MKNKWPQTTLADISENLDNQRVPISKLKRNTGQIPYYGATGVVDYVDDYIFDEQLLLVGEDGADWSAGANTAYIINGKSWVNNHAHVLRIKNADIQFIENYLNFTDLRLHTSGTTRGKLNKSDLMNIRVPNPIISIQKKVGDILSSIDEAIQKSDEIINKVELLNKGIIIQLLDKSSTHTVKLNTVCSKITDGTHRTPKYIADGVPFLRINDIQSDQINWERCKYISVDEHKELIKRCKPEKGDVLLSKNGTIGITKVVNWEREFSIFVSLCLIKPDRSKVLPEYLAEVVGSDYVMNQVRKRSKQGTVTNLHLEEIRDFDIPLPDTDRQKDVISIIQDLKLKKVKEETTYQSLIKLKNGIMQGIFSQKVQIN